MNNFFARILPFVGMGIFLVIIVVAIVLFSYLLLFGGLVGLILFGIAYIKQRFFPNKSMMQSEQAQHTEKHQGKIYEHKDQK